MNFVRIIEQKREGQTLEPGQIQELVEQFTLGSIPDYQMAAFLMAVFFRGMDRSEIQALTRSMRESGDQLRFASGEGPLVDKHSTGGVGDKTSLVLAPLLASLGCRVPMISGRGLGITGGTLDKLESIPGFRVRLSAEEITHQVESIGCCICAQTESMVPADARLYALRDVTGTVPSIPLITASILSKKLAENISALVLDVKFGEGAFMTSLNAARELARSMVEIGVASGVKTAALLTRMDAPLGCAAGNWVEVRESVKILQGEGPQELRSLIIELAAEVLRLSGVEPDFSKGQQRSVQALNSGQALERWEKMLKAQGADLAACHSLLRQDCAAPASFEVRAAGPGFVQRVSARSIGESLRQLGAGRSRKEDLVDPWAGIDQLAHVGQPVVKGDLLARIQAASHEKVERLSQSVAAAFRIGDQAPEKMPLIVERIG